LLAGVKYCGGCRAAFDRKAEAEKISEAAAEGMVFEAAEEDRQYDTLLVVCGCPSRCANVSPYKAENIVYISEEGGAAEAAKEINAIGEGKPV